MCLYWNDLTINQEVLAFCVHSFMSLNENGDPLLNSGTFLMQSIWVLVTLIQSLSGDNKQFFWDSFQQEVKVQEKYCAACFSAFV